MGPIVLIDVGVTCRGRFLVLGVRGLGVEVVAVSPVALDVMMTVVVPGSVLLTTDVHFVWVVDQAVGTSLVPEMLMCRGVEYRRVAVWCVVC